MYMLKINNSNKNSNTIDIKNILSFLLNKKIIFDSLFEVYDHIFNIFDTIKGMSSFKLDTFDLSIIKKHADNTIKVVKTNEEIKENYIQCKEYTDRICKKFNNDILIKYTLDLDWVVDIIITGRDLPKYVHYIKKLEDVLEMIDLFNLEIPKDIEIKKDFLLIHNDDALSQLKLVMDVIKCG